MLTVQVVTPVHNGATGETQFWLQLETDESIVTGTAVIEYLRYEALATGSLTEEILNEGRKAGSEKGLKELHADRKASDYPVPDELSRAFPGAPVVPPFRTEGAQTHVLDLLPTDQLMIWARKLLPVPETVLLPRLVGCHSYPLLFREGAHRFKIIKDFPAHADPWHLIRVQFLDGEGQPVAEAQGLRERVSRAG